MEITPEKSTLRVVVRVKNPWASEFVCVCVSVCVFSVKFKDIQCRLQVRSLWFNNSSSSLWFVAVLRGPFLPLRMSIHRLVASAVIFHGSSHQEAGPTCRGN